MKTSALLLAGAMLLTAGYAAAQDNAPAADAAVITGVTLGEVGYGGTGCPDGTATVAVSPDQRSIAILFDAYTAEIGGPNSRPLVRVSCQLAIPVAVPDGLSVATFPVDFLGYSYLPEGATAMYSVEYFFAGSQGTLKSVTQTGPTSGSFVLQDPLTDETAMWSDCGADVILRTNSNLLLRGGTDPGVASIEGAVGYRLQWKAC